MAGRQLTLDTVARGAVPGLFEHELKRVLANIDDPNTDPKAVREITIKLLFKPRDGSSEEIATRASVSSRLAPLKAVHGTVFMGTVGSELVAVEYDPKQIDAFRSDEGDPARVHPINRNREAAS